MSKFFLKKHGHLIPKLIAVASIGGIILFMFWMSRQNAIAFCRGNDCQLSRLMFRGQGIKMSIADENSLQYLLARPRQKDEPTSVGITNGYSFDAWVRGRFGMSGRIDVFISQPVAFLRLTYFDSDFGDFNQRYITIGMDAPASLRQCLDFLVYSNRIALSVPTVGSRN